MSVPDRRAMLDRVDRTLSVRRQCALVGVARSSVYRPRRLANDNDVVPMRLTLPHMGTARVARAFSVDFTHWNGAVICPAFARGAWPLASMRSAERGAKSSLRA